MSNLNSIQGLEGKEIEVSPKLKIFIQKVTKGRACLVLVFPGMDEVEVGNLTITHTGKNTIIDEEVIPVSNEVISEEEDIRKYTYGRGVQLSDKAAVTITNLNTRITLTLSDPRNKKVPLSIFT